MKRLAGVPLWAILPISVLVIVIVVALVGHFVNWPGFST